MINHKAYKAKWSVSINNLFCPCQSNCTPAHKASPEAQQTGEMHYVNKVVMTLHFLWEQTLFTDHL